jgi:hypothetical protein
MESKEATPHCIECGRQMQLNTAASSEFLKQYLCGCNGKLKYVNVHAGDLTSGRKR